MINGSALRFVNYASSVPCQFLSRRTVWENRRGVSAWGSLLGESGVAFEELWKIGAWDSAWGIIRPGRFPVFFHVVNSLHRSLRFVHE